MACRLVDLQRRWIRHYFGVFASDRILGMLKSKEPRDVRNGAKNCAVFCTTPTRSVSFEVALFWISAPTGQP